MSSPSLSLSCPLSFSVSLSLSFGPTKANCRWFGRSKYPSTQSSPLVFQQPNPSVWLQVGAETAPRGRFSPLVDRANDGRLLPPNDVEATPAWLISIINMGTMLHEETFPRISQFHCYSRTHSITKWFQHRPFIVCLQYFLQFMLLPMRECCSSQTRERESMPKSHKVK